MATPQFPTRPPALSITKTCIYKTINQISIPIDIYVPATSSTLSPIMLFIHGGGWTGSGRSDYCRPMFQHFTELGFIVTSMDYRLLPETSWEGMLEDIRDVEGWLRTKLGKEIGVEVDGERIVVVGASAGAHLALMTPKVWTQPPVAILSMYGPTDMLSVPSLIRGRIAKIPLPPLTPQLLALATNFSNPPTGFAPPKSLADLMNPRGLMGLIVLKEELIAEFILRGLSRSGNSELILPEKGSVVKREVEAISALYLCESVKYPPTYQVMGTEDEVFETSHVEEFDKKLRRMGVESKFMVVPGVGHAFDMSTVIGSETDVEVVRPAVEWVAGFARVENN